MVTIKITFLLTLISIFVIVRQLRRFLKHLALAKQSGSWFYQIHPTKSQVLTQTGIPYVIVPVTGYQLWWLLTYKLWMPVLRCLPSSLTASWIELAAATLALDHLFKLTTS